LQSDALEKKIKKAKLTLGRASSDAKILRTYLVWLKKWENKYLSNIEKDNQRTKLLIHQSNLFEFIYYYLSIFFKKIGSYLRWYTIFHFRQRKEEGFLLQILFEDMKAAYSTHTTDFSLQ